MIQKILVKNGHFWEISKFGPRCVHHIGVFKKIETLRSKGHGRSNRFAYMGLFLNTCVEHTEKFPKNAIFLNKMVKNSKKITSFDFGPVSAPQG